MKFHRYGRSYHPVLKTASDLISACDLDESLWVATSAPISAFRMDPVFLSMLDSDKDNRVKCGELIEAIQWLTGLSGDTHAMENSSTTLKKSAVHSGHPDAKDVLHLLERISPDSDAVTLDDIRAWRTRLEARPVSESGVVLPDAAGDQALKAVIEDMLKVTPGAEHPSGKKGLHRNTMDAFFSARDKRLAWLDQVAATDDLDRSIILPLQEKTASAFAAFTAIRGVMNHYFTLCDAVDLDPAARAKIWPGIAAETAWDDPEALRKALRDAPIAQPDPERIFKFSEQGNPAWAREMHSFRQEMMVPLLDRTDDILTQEMWETLCERLAPYEAWINSEASPELNVLPEDRIRDMSPEKWKEPLTTLIDTQSEAAVSLNQVRTAEKLSLYQGHILSFSNNFIAFPFLYDPNVRAGFEMGTLIMDARRFTLAVRVPDRAAYLKNIEDGTMFIMILELVHTQRNEKMDVAVPATWGKQGNLKVGKHGVFEHVDGSQWFATVAHITDNPISLGEAMVEPFKRLGSAVTRKVESMTQTAEKKLDQTGSQVVEQVQQPAPAAAPAGNALAGGGIAIAAMGSSLAFITKIFSELQFAGLMKGLGAAVLAVLIPSTIIAYMRLRRRDLSVLLEGSGWAINSRMRLNTTQCRTFTKRPNIPKGSELTRDREWWMWQAVWALVLINLFLRAFKIL